MRDLKEFLNEFCIAEEFYNIIAIKFNFFFTIKDNNP